MSTNTKRYYMNIDRSKIVHPNITLSQAALDQFNLIFQNDFTLKGKVIRLSIDGKKCEGFLYAVGFSEAHNDDYIVKVKDLVTPIHLDPFCAYYLSEAFIEFAQDQYTHEDGFIITNLNQDKFQKKFWLSNKDSLLPLA